MYELNGEVRGERLRGARRVLRPGGRFVMMERCEPRRPLPRLLYRVRLSARGSSASREFARDEVPFLRRFFGDVGRELSPASRSSFIWGVKHEDVAAAG